MGERPEGRPSEPGLRGLGTWSPTPSSKTDVGRLCRQVAVDRRILDRLKVIGPVQPYGPDDNVENLPASYLEFVHALGYGRLGRLFLIYPPALSGCDRLAVSSAALRTMLAESEQAGLVEYEPDGSPELIRRLLPFGIGENGETLAWDAQSASADGERAVFLIGTKTLGVWLVGQTMYDFIEFVTSESFTRILPGYGALLPTFEPLVLQ